MQVSVDGGTNQQAELSQLKMPELRKRAKEEGVAEDAIEVRMLSATVHNAFSRIDLSLRVYARGHAAHSTCMTGSSRSGRAEESRHRADRQYTAGKGHQLAS